MSNLSDLKKSISNMSDGEALSLIMSVRSNRRKIKARPKARKSKPLNVGSMLGKISPETARAMLKALGNADR